jgi:hypothetical protein
MWRKIENNVTPRVEKGDLEMYQMNCMHTQKKAVAEIKNIMDGWVEDKPLVPSLPSLPFSFTLPSIATCLHPSVSRFPSMIDISAQD